MKVLVTGNPRSGTLSMKNMLRANGFDVEHERCGADGTVSCFFFTPATWYPREKLTARRHMQANGKDEVFNWRDFETRIHLVRDPLKCIPSMRKVCGVGHQKWIHDHLGVPVTRGKDWKLLWAMRAWYRTNSVCEKIPGIYRIRIERVQADWPVTLGKAPQVLHQHASTGTRKSSPVKWKDLVAVDADLADRIADMAERYGY